MGRCGAVSMNRLSDRLEWRRHLIGGRLSSGNSIAMATAAWLRTGAVGGLVTYSVIFTCTYTAYAGTCADIAFVYHSFAFVLQVMDGHFVRVRGSQVEMWSFSKMLEASGCRCFTNDSLMFVNLGFYHVPEVYETTKPTAPFVLCDCVCLEKWGNAHNCM